MTRLLNGKEYRVETAFGASYTLTHLATGKSAFFQGEDAGFFIDALAAAESMFPNYSADQLGALLWCDHEYGAVAQHTPVEPWGPYCRLSDKRTFVPVVGTVGAVL